MVFLQKGWRQSKVVAKEKRENLYRHVFAKRNVSRLRDALQQR